MSYAKSKIAVVYLARGADADCVAAFRRFISSYSRYPAGYDHQLYVVYKGFQSTASLFEAKALFAALAAESIDAADGGFDFGAYVVAAQTVQEERICFLNTNSEFVGDAWLWKLAVNHDPPGVGVVGATGSFESLSGLDSRFPTFPNAHLRSNAFVISRRLFLEITDGVRIHEKLDAYLLESGPESLTRRMLRRGFSVLVVGRNGRAYPPRWWPASETFRRVTQDNLLVADNQTRNYLASTWSMKQAMVQNTWGRFIDPRHAYQISD